MCLRSNTLLNPVERLHQSHRCYRACTWYIMLCNARRKTLDKIHADRFESRRTVILSRYAVVLRAAVAYDVHDLSTQPLADLEQRAGKHCGTFEHVPVTYLYTCLEVTASADSCGRLIAWVLSYAQPTFFQYPQYTPHILHASYNLPHWLLPVSTKLAVSTGITGIAGFDDLCVASAQRSAGNAQEAHR
jgi:hypothetical protein